MLLSVLGTLGLSTQAHTASHGAIGGGDTDGVGHRSEGRGQPFAAPVS